MGGIEQERNRSVWRSATGMLLGKAHKLVGDPPERIQLKRMLARTRLEKLIEPLLEINRRDSRHVIQVIALAIPRKRRARGWSVVRMEKVVRSGKVLRLRKRGRRVAKIRRMIIEKRTAVLARRAACKRDAHCNHRLHRSRLHSNQPRAPLGERMGE